MPEEQPFPPPAPVTKPAGGRTQLPTAVRERAFLVALVAIVLLGAVAWVRPTAYVALGPGPVTDTLGADQRTGKPLIAVKGFKTYPTSGRLELTTVTVTDKLTLVQALTDWLQGDYSVVPRDLIYEKGKSDQQVETDNQNEMAASRLDAVTAVLTQLHLLKVVVASTNKGAPADGALIAGDEITAINGQLVHGAADVRAEIAKVKVGQRVSVRFLRKGVQQVVVVNTVAAPNDATRPVVGVVLNEKTPEGSDVQVVGLDNVGGPSAGMMFALGIYDTLTPGMLTGGKTIAGTGTIDASGNVGPIGGVALKLIGARRSGAEWFLTPADNCAEAKKAIPKGLHLARVATLAEGIAAAKAIGEGRTDIPTC